jgi:hypothetical protein
MPSRRRSHANSLGGTPIRMMPMAYQSAEAILRCI